MTEENLHTDRNFTSEEKALGTQRYLCLKKKKKRNKIHWEASVFFKKRTKFIERHLFSTKKRTKFIERHLCCFFKKRIKFIERHLCFQKKKNNKIHWEWLARVTITEEDLQTDRNFTSEEEGLGTQRHLFSKEKKTKFYWEWLSGHHNWGKYPCWQEFCLRVERPGPQMPLAHAIEHPGASSGVGPWEMPIISHHAKGLGLRPWCTSAPSLLCRPKGPQRWQNWLQMAITEHRPRDSKAHYMSLRSISPWLPNSFRNIRRHQKFWFHHMTVKDTAHGGGGRGNHPLAITTHN